MDEPERGQRAPLNVLVRDLVIFELKLLLDGVGDILFAQLAVLALLLDLVVGGPRRGRYFYGVLRAGERWDLWLNLYNPTKGEEPVEGGLLEAGLHDANSLLGRLERLARERGISDPRQERSREGDPGEK